MKLVSKATLLAGLFICVSAVNANGDIKSVNDVVGTWKLQTTKNSLTDKKPIDREDTWVFKDSKVTILHIPREGSYYDQSPVSYEIDDGKLKVAIIGSSRFDLFSVEEINDKTMVLKNKFGGYFYFDKK